MSDTNPTINSSTHLIVEPNRKEIARFMSKVHIDPESGCWEWTAALKYGYGTIKYRGRMEQAYRWSYAWLIGPIPRGDQRRFAQVDHLCRNCACVNPCHLELVTQRVNILRGASQQAANAKKTHCVNGHEFTPENTYRRKKGGRLCLTCTKEYNKTERSKEVQKQWRSDAEVAARRKAATLRYTDRKRQEKALKKMA